MKQLIYYEGDDEIFLKGELINGLLTASLQEVKESALHNREELVKAHEKKLKLAEYKMGLVRDRYSEGKVTVVEITEKETELIKSYSEYLVAISGFNRELAHLEASISFFHDEWISKKEIYQPV